MESADGPAVLFPGELTVFTSTAPPQYACSNCGATGCKLWRLLMPPHVPLACARCAASGQTMEISDMDSRGFWEGPQGRTDQIGWFIPALPKRPSFHEFWSPVAAPLQDRLWWAGLPNYPEVT